MATRYIGNAVIRISYRDAGDYSGTVSVPGSATVWYFGGLRPPMLGFDVGYDSPVAYDRMASAAVSFGSDPGAASNTDDDTITDKGRATAQVISDATCWAQNDRGAYSVRRSKNGPERVVA